MKELHKKILFRAANAIRGGTAPDPELADLLVLAIEDAADPRQHIAPHLSIDLSKPGMEPLKIRIPDEAQTSHAYLPLTRELAETICRIDEMIVRERVQPSCGEWQELVQHAIRVRGLVVQA